MVLVHVLALLALSAMGDANPFNFNRHDRDVGTAYIDCSDIELAARMKAVGIKFSCLRDTDNDILTALAEKPTPTAYEALEGLGTLPRLEEEEKITLVLPGREGFLEEQIDLREECVDPERCAPRLRAPGAKPSYDSFRYESPRCPLGHAFVKEVGQCLPLILRDEDSDEGYFNPNMDASGARPCAPGYVYDLDKDTCVLNKKVFSVDVTSLEDFQVDCGPSAVFLRGTCVTLTSATMEAPELREGVTISPVKKPKCPPGFIPNPSIGVCLEVIGNPKGQKKRPTPAPIKAGPRPASLSDEEDVAETKRKSKCPVGTIHNPSTGVCLPDSGGSHRPKPSSLKVASAGVKKDQKDKEPKCEIEDGYVYVAEIDLCLKNE